MTPGSAAQQRHVGILIPQTWSIRNVVTSGLLRMLVDRGYTVTLLVRKTAGWDTLDGIPAGVRIEPLLAPRQRHAVKGRAFLAGIMHAAFDRRFGLVEYRSWSHRYLHRPLPGAWLHRTVPGAGILAAAQTAPVRSALRRVREMLFLREYDTAAIREQMERLGITLLWSTVCVDSAELPYVLTARRMGIRTVTSVLSFDNLTTRPEIPLFDLYTVWNARMRDEVLRFYPSATPERVVVTGTPQFDFHRRPAFCWPRAETLRRLGLPDGARYILYATNAEVFTPTEPAMVRTLAERMAQHPATAEHWIVVRMHPLDNVARWKDVMGDGRRIRVTSPWAVPHEPDGWALIGADDQRSLVSGLTHADVCVNMCSTASLDAALLDRPVVCVGFAMEPGSDEDVFCHRTYATPHYQPLVDSKGLVVVGDWDAFLRAVVAGVTEPEAGRTERLRMVTAECGVPDGRATDRVVEVLARALEGGRP